MWSLPQAQRAIIIAGCLAAAYTQLTTSPATVEYARGLGATELHIGILGALPTLMLFCQFLAAIVVNHLQYRRRLWFWSAMAHRLMLAPLALGPWLWPETPGMVWVWLLVGLTALNQALLHFSSPLWLSWMGDYLPHDGLSTYWGARQYWMQWTSAVSLFAAATLLYELHLEIRNAFMIFTLVATVLGVADLLLFFKVPEPPVTRVPQPRLRDVLVEPFRKREFKRFIKFTCFWHFAAMAGAPFISLYLLEEVGMSLNQVLLLWTCSWVGGAMFSHTLGRWSDRYGARPVLVLCVAFKSLNMIALLLIPPEPTLAFWTLAPIFMIDQVLNAGILIANNGFMLKHSPAQNRTMYIAASTALAGMVGGVTSIGAGWLMCGMAGQRWELFGHPWGHFHVMFASSILLRWIATIWVQQIREPNAIPVKHVMGEILGGLPWRPMLFPIGLYRSVEEPELADRPAVVTQRRPLAGPRWLDRQRRKTQGPTADQVSPVIPKP